MIFNLKIFAFEMISIRKDTAMAVNILRSGRRKSTLGASCCVHIQINTNHTMNGKIFVDNLVFCVSQKVRHKKGAAFVFDTL